jgi:hypothetical protein
MTEKLDSQFEKPLETPEISKKDFLALRENQAFLSFIEKFKSLQEEAGQKGIDISEAINYLEKGEGSPELVRNVLSGLAQKDIGEFKQAVESSSRPLSEQEIMEIESQTKHGKILEEFNFFMGFPGLKKKIETERIAQPQQAPIEGWTMKEILQGRSEYSAEWAKKVLKARKEFQESMWDELRKYVDLWQSKEGLTPQVREEITDSCELLMRKAAKLADQYKIGWHEIFSVEKDFEWYISKDYIEGGDFRPPNF